jgi:type VI secretion system protein ImpK
MDHDAPQPSPDPARTIILPTPGKRSTRPDAAARQPPPAPDMDLSLPEADGSPSGINPLVAAANPVLNLAPRLRATLQHPQPIALRDALADGIRAFERRAAQAGIARENIIAARYALCTLLDEAAVSTPWGGSGIWSRHSLLVLFHNEAYGGEKFFQLLAKLAEKPGANLELLELMYLCLALGLEGRYRVAPNGRAQLATLRERLAFMLRRERGEYERSLSPHWEGVTAARARMMGYVPAWVGAAALALCLLAVFFAFSMALTTHSDAAYAQIQSLGIRPAAPTASAGTPSAAAPATAAPATAVAVTEPRLAPLLRQDIERGLLAVRDDPGSSTVTIRGDGLFEPGSAAVADGYRETLRRLSGALAAMPGKVQVIGHTDNQPIHTPRFPSNWHLSVERARAVMRLLVEGNGHAERFSAEGRADTDPLVPNGSPAQRAQNRRVEIVLSALPAPAR